MIEKKKYRKLKFPLYELGKRENALDKWPELGKHNEFKAIPSSRINQVITYLIVLYDPDSYLHKEYADLAERKVAALKLAGLSNKSIHNSDWVDDMVNLRDVGTLNMVMCLLSKVYHKRKYAEWITLQQELEEYTKRRLEPIKTNNDDKKEMEALEKKAKLRSQCQEIHQQLDGMEKDIFGDDDELIEIAKELRFDTPENFVKSFQVA